MVLAVWGIQSLPIFDWGTTDSQTLFAARAAQLIGKFISMFSTSVCVCDFLSIEWMMLRESITIESIFFCFALSAQWAQLKCCNKLRNAKWKIPNRMWENCRYDKFISLYVFFSDSSISSNCWFDVRWRGANFVVFFCFCRTKLMSGWHRWYDWHSFNSIANNGF